MPGAGWTELVAVDPTWIELPMNWLLDSFGMGISGDYIMGTVVIHVDALAGPDPAWAGMFVTAMSWTELQATAITWTEVAGA